MFCETLRVSSVLAAAVGALTPGLAFCLTIYRVGGEHPIYQIRKENLSITLVQEQEQLTLTAAKVDEPLVRLMVLEAIAELKELVEGIQRLDSPEALGTDLVTGLLDEGDEDNG